MKYITFTNCYEKLNLGYGVYGLVKEGKTAENIFIVAQ